CPRARPAPTCPIVGWADGGRRARQREPGQPRRRGGGAAPRPRPRGSRPRRPAVPRRSPRLRLRGGGALHRRRRLDQGRPGHASPQRPDPAPLPGDGVRVRGAKRLANPRRHAVMSRALSRAKATARVAALPRIVIYVVGTGLWLTGALWLLFHYLLKRQGWLGGVQPLESWWLRLHGAFAFVAIWTFGLLWGTHVVPGW